MKELAELMKVLARVSDKLDAQSAQIIALQVRVSLLESAISNGITLADAHALTILREGGLFPERA